MGVGRPPKYETPEDMQKIIDLYFLACSARTTGDLELLSGLSEEELLIINDIPSSIPTVCGLAYSLNLSRQALLDYTKKDGFLDTIKRAKQLIEMYLEERLFANACTGTIFNLKNNFGWKDSKNLDLGNKDDKPFEQKSTLETGPGLSTTLEALENAVTTRKDNIDEGDNKT